MNIPCSHARDCVCTDNPFQNLSSEDPDAPRYPSQKWRPRTPNRGEEFTTPWCRGICVSTVSQADADQCADLQALLCIDENYVGNDEITVTTDCP